jgi:hypothetical protein
VKNEKGKVFRVRAVDNNIHSERNGATFVVEIPIAAEGQQG